MKAKRVVAYELTMDDEEMDLLIKFLSMERTIMKKIKDFDRRCVFTENDYKLSVPMCHKIRDIKVVSRRDAR